MDLIIDFSALPKCELPATPAQRRRALARALPRLGFMPSLALPEFAAPLPPRPGRRRDEASPDWRPL